jgi:hypothetical protein
MEFHTPADLPHTRQPPPARTGAAQRFGIRIMRSINLTVKCRKLIIS